ncbi:MAG TPA: phosphoribosyltransferase family protein [Thermoanaerobaculia bacterium]|nr:phosphoribosyltransferase family protein [Thermoanaerobaculia bacterium]
MREAGVRTRFSAQQIASRVQELGARIRADAGDQEIVLIGILKGSSVFLADLLRAIPGEVRYHFVDVVRKAESDDEPMALNFLTHFEMEGRNLYLLKDVVATGVIENYLLTQFRTRNPAVLRLVALLDRPNARRTAVQIDYSAFEVGEGTFVGYGLDHQGRFENLPYIGEMDEDYTVSRRR